MLNSEMGGHVALASGEQFDLGEPKSVFQRLCGAQENILNKLHLNQDIADYCCMMPPTPKVKGD
ncbi:hypothetical protein JWR97_09960 [Pseudomonas cedrina subsp. fulgida]|nr:hypothetical protein [Pseudomonas cedrina subsp. fulgida]